MPQIRVRGIVQGVGFRPFVWRLAQRLGLRGTVYNDSEGVLIQIWGTQIEEFLSALEQEAPPLAQIQSIECSSLEGAPPADFQILISPEPVCHSASPTAVSPDIVTCSDCASEIFDATARRYRYPFTNCTHCGPRFSIIRELPYDRMRTEMAHFEMCPDCLSEYSEPNDRRYHAQPIACPACGPHCWLSDATGRDLAYKDPIAAAAALLKEGQILAIKGLGGFQLACDAQNEAAVARLRQRKRRPHKPFAVMVPSSDKRPVLQGPSGPIALFRDKQERLAESIAPGLEELGLLLPTTPLHLILLHDFGRPLVMTSGNLSSEPQCIDNQEALDKLQGIADYWLMHDRNILCRIDDSVLRQTSSRVQMLRHARGYAPQIVPLPQGFQSLKLSKLPKKLPKILALGSQEKAAFVLLSEHLILSQYFGDLSQLSNWRDFQKNLRHYSRLYRFEAQILACDAHPEYISSKYARQQAQELQEVQHHHAHIAACMLEYQLPQEPVIGVVWDGLGYGEDSWAQACHLWGAEFFVADYVQAKRVASLQPIPLLGGQLAALEPWRCLLAWLLQLGLSKGALHKLLRQLQPLFPDSLLEQLPDSLLAQLSGSSPQSSSGGRLFDAVGALLLGRSHSSYDAQAAVELEALAWRCKEKLSPYPFAWQSFSRPDSTELFWQLDLRPLWLELLEEFRFGTNSGGHFGDNARCALRFHVSLAHAICAAVLRIAAQNSRRAPVILSGGVFQNSLLLHLCRTELEKHREIVGPVLSPERFPANDGALALGQAVIAAAKNSLSSL